MSLTHICTKVCILYGNSTKLLHSAFYIILGQNVDSLNANKLKVLKTRKEIRAELNL